MIRDARMQALVTKDKEPITPLLHRVRELYEQQGVSSIIVMGGSGDYLEVADLVIMLDNYQVRDVTAEARRLAGPARIQFENDQAPPLGPRHPRRISGKALDPSRGRKEVKIEPRGLDTLIYGRTDINIASVEQLVDVGQVRAIGLLIHHYGRNHAATASSLPEGLAKALKEVEEQGLDILPLWKRGDLALPRRYEVAAAINRMRRKIP